MSNNAIHNCASITHLYVHIPFCARICPYCAFYKERADSSQTQRFCEALLAELDERRPRWPVEPETIFIGGGTPTALTTAQLKYLLGGFRDRLDLSSIREWTVEANPGSVSPRSESFKLGGTEQSGVQSWDDECQAVGREHTMQAEGLFTFCARQGSQIYYRLM